MDHKKILLAIGLTEMAIGFATLLGLAVSLVLFSNAKAPNVFLFVTLTACISFVLGVGIITGNRYAYILLIYFSSVIVISKILTFAGIISLNGAIETNIAPGIKNFFSVIYHSFLVVYLRTKEAKNIFVEIHES